MSYRPPRLFHRFFQWFCHPELLPSIEGDLMELYDKRIKHLGRRRADVRFALDVLLLFRPGIVRPPSKIEYINPTPMWKNYLIIGWRNIRRNRGYSLINIGGLTIGMAVTIILGLSIYYELSYDHYHPQFDRMARVIQNVTLNGNLETWKYVPYPLGEELRAQYGSDFESVVMCTGLDSSPIVNGDLTISKTGAYLEPEGPELLSLTMIRGSIDALKDPRAILLSASAAKSIFGDGDPMGRNLQLDGQDTKVAGLYSDLPVNSSFANLHFVGSWKLMFDTNGLKNIQDPWRPNGWELYVRLIPGADLSMVSSRIKDAVMKHMNEKLALRKPELFLFAMKDWHLRSEFSNGVNVGGAIQYVVLFSIIAAFVLILACINFMNLSTAQSERRAREVGIRKSMGSVRGQLIGQFFFESVLIALVALILALVLVKLLLPAFNLLVDKQISMPWTDYRFLVITITFALFTGLLAGAYPAVFLSSFKPVNVLKGVMRGGRWASLPRRVMVVVQFTVSVTLIIGTWVVVRQIEYAKNRPVGYTREGLVAVPMLTNKLRQHIDAFREEVMKTGEITQMARANSRTTSQGNSSSGFQWAGKDPGLSVDFPFVYVSHDYGQTVGWNFMAGRDFSRDFPSDTAALIINESAARFIGFKEPVGETIRWEDIPFTIIGVVEDMVIQSPYEPVPPTLFMLTPNGGYLILARMKSGVSPADAVSAIEHVYKKYAPGDPFNYSFVDQDYARKFGAEEKVLRQAGILAILAIFISCLGIFGLASFVVERRTKEVGVRKVLGASLVNLWQLLSREFVVLVVISFALAFPAAGYFVGDWLAQYNYHVTVGWWVYAASGGAAIAITLATVSYHTLKAAGANPVKSLRVE
jgi:ABC-type antimicrobial peptide transport system permease subunit